MRTTVDIPDALYRELKMRAASEHTSVKALILQGVEVRLRTEQPVVKLNRFQGPIVDSGEPGSLHLTNDMIDELLYS